MFNKRFLKDLQDLGRAYCIDWGHGCIFGGHICRKKGCFVGLHPKADAIFNHF